MKALFRFSIRDMLWLTVVVCLGLGWWRHYGIYSTEMRVMVEKSGTLHQQELLDCIAAHGGFKNVHYIDFKFSRFYDTEMEIGWVENKFPRTRMKVHKGVIDFEDKGATMIPHNIHYFNPDTLPIK